MPFNCSKPCRRRTERTTQRYSIYSRKRIPPLATRGRHDKRKKMRTCLGQGLSEYVTRPRVTERERADPKWGRKQSNYLFIFGAELHCLLPVPDNRQQLPIS